MPVFVCLLRAINLGSKNRLPMDTLRGICESMGHTQVQTYIQSGNVVFRAKGKDASKIASQIGQAIQKSAGFPSDVILRTRQELEAVVARNPFASRSDVAGDKLLVTFFDRQPEQDAIAKVNAMKLPPEEFKVVGRELYVFFPAGVGRSKFPAASIGKTLQVSGTARNWNTVLKLLDMAIEAEALDT